MLSDLFGEVFPGETLVTDAPVTAAPAPAAITIPAAAAVSGKKNGKARATATKRTRSGKDDAAPEVCNARVASV